MIAELSRSKKVEFKVLSFKMKIIFFTDYSIELNFFLEIFSLIKFNRIKT